jgi:hypothetical protein
MIEGYIFTTLNHVPNMKKFFLLLSFAFICLVSCSSDDTSDMTVEGTWKLVSWNVPDGFDINNDSIKSLNLLDEIDCTNNETLLFENNGIVSSNQTFNPKIEIALSNEILNTYTFNVVCDNEGVVSFASNYTQNGNTIVLNEGTASIKSNELSRVFLDAIKIYNEDFTAVIATKDLTLIYIKQ